MPHKSNHPNTRHAPKSALDDHPTPPWATRAFFEYVVPDYDFHAKTFLDPACGRGHMIRAIREEGYTARGCDIQNYKGLQGGVGDYTNLSLKFDPYNHVVMTNPPFKLANAFLERALDEAKYGVAILAQSRFAEGGKDVKTSRWQRILRDRPPNRVALFSARVSFAKGKVIQSRPVFHSHSWFWWDKTAPARHEFMDTKYIWIPPEAQAKLERKSDYAKSYTQATVQPRIADLNASRSKITYVGLKRALRDYSNEDFGAT